MPRAVPSLSYSLLYCARRTWQGHQWGKLTRKVTWLAGLISSPASIHFAFNNLMTKFYLLTCIHICHFKFFLFDFFSNQATILSLCSVTWLSFYSCHWSYFCCNVTGFWWGCRLLFEKGCSWVRWFLSNEFMSKITGGSNTVNFP